MGSLRLEDVAERARGVQDADANASFARDEEEGLIEEAGNDYLRSLSGAAPTAPGGDGGEDDENEAGYEFLRSLRGAPTP
jgi:hypothetical protein